eukprot:365023-Chlamydomonas_euryale.AAC.36
MLLRSNRECQRGVPPSALLPPLLTPPAPLARAPTPPRVAAAAARARAMMSAALAASDAKPADGSGRAAGGGSGSDSRWCGWVADAAARPLRPRTAVGDVVGLGVLVASSRASSRCGRVCVGAAGAEALAWAAPAASSACCDCSLPVVVWCAMVVV